MSATEELRSMLDKCGSEYEQSYIEGVAEYVHVTKWKMKTGNECTFYEIEDGYPPYFTRMFIETPTAAQAVAATIPHAASTYAALLQESKARMNLQSDYNDQSVRIHNQRKQLREMQAALERGKCRNIAPAYLDFLCSECGFTHYHSDENDDDKGNDWKYCPSCGRKVVW